MAVKVLKNKENPETPEILAESIIKISDAFQELLSTKLTEEAIVTLLKDMPGMGSVGKPAIRLVLAKLKTLKGYYIRK